MTTEESNKNENEDDEDLNIEDDENLSQNIPFVDSQQQLERANLNDENIEWKTEFF